MSDFSKNLVALRSHLRTHAVRTDGPFTLRSGEISDWYIDARQTTLDGAGATLVGEAMLDLLPPSIDAVGGMTMGADPIAIATAVVANLNERALTAFSVRKQVKDHGTGGRVVGPVRPGDLVAIVEDTTTTGGALTEAIEAAREFGLGVEMAVSLVDRSSGAVADAMADQGVRYLALFTPGDLGV